MREAYRLNRHLTGFQEDGRQLAMMCIYMTPEILSFVEIEKGMIKAIAPYRQSDLRTMKYLCLIVISLMCTGADGAEVPPDGEVRLHQDGQRLYIGDEITFKLFNDDKGWYTRFITDFDVENGYIVFGQQRIHIDSISSIQLDKRNGMKFIGTVLMAGGANTIIFSIGYPLAVGEDPQWVGVGWGAGFLGLGYLIRKLDKKKQFKIGKRKWLRLLDLNMIGPPLESKS